MKPDEEKKEDEYAVAMQAFNEQLSSDDVIHLGKIIVRLQNAHLAKNQLYPQLNMKSIYTYYEENEKIANTNHLDKKKNDDDVVVSAGTVEQKLDSLLSQINNLNLSPEVMAFDDQNEKYDELAEALGDIIHDTEVRDMADGAGDEEKKLLRQRELLKQGTVFVQESWLTRWETKKVLKNKKYNGEFKGWEGYTEQVVKVFEGPSRNLLYSPNVFLGDITQFYMDNQPYIFFCTITNYEDAEAVWGKFENWKYVVKGKIETQIATQPKTIFDTNWRLSELRKNQVEILVYQDQPDDEFQVIINGIPMFPIGFPLSAITPGGKYNVVKQVYRVLSDKFAYGGSFVGCGSIKELSKLIDEMLTLFVLKTRKSFTPAYINTSGRIISKKVLNPGRISMGLQPGDLTPIAGNEVQGVTAGEANVLTQFQELIDKSTVSDQFTGQAGPAGTTATEANLLQTQARLTLGLTVAACTLLEKKLAYLRLYNILENYFEPTGTDVASVDDARNEIVATYRNVTRQNVNVPGRGNIDRQVHIVPGGKLPAAKTVREMEKEYEAKYGVESKKIFIDADAIKAANLTWYIVVKSKERDSSDQMKRMFGEMLNGVMGLVNIGSIPNKAGFEKEFARVWNKNTNDLFIDQPAGGQPPPGMPPQGGQPGMPPIGGPQGPAPKGQVPPAKAPQQQMPVTPAGLPNLDTTS